MEKREEKIEVGVGGCYGIGSDCYPFTIIEVSENKKTVKIQYDNYEAVKDGTFNYYGNQKYNYFPNPDGQTETLTLRKNGRYVQKGSDLHSCGYYSFHGRVAYQDPSF